MMTPFEWVVGDSSKDHTVTALTSVTTSPVTERYTTMRDLTYALSANTASGVVRGRPTPSRGTRTAASRCGNIFESLPWPGPTAMTMGRPLPSLSMAKLKSPLVAK